ncbi:helix-turn-helix domain-containing protein [Nocardiopsis terrae]
MSSSPTPNKALALARQELGLSRAQLARRVAIASQGQIAHESADKALKRLETGQVQSPTDIYRRLISEVLHTSPAALFGAPRPKADESRPGQFIVSCRKYIPVRVDPTTADQIIRCPEMTAYSIDGVDCARTKLTWPHDPHALVSVTAFPFGVVVAELRETNTFANLAELAVWRHTSYETDRPRVDALLRSTWPSISVSPEYVLGTWWLAQSSWADRDLDTAVRIMSTPSALLRRQGEPTIEQLRAGAEIAERTVWQTGFEASNGLVDFGVPGVSVGYASWSGIAYAPVAADRALQPGELGDFETLCQALWSWCHSINTTVEAGEDPSADPTYGWRWLRGICSRITRPRPTETRQVRAMRDAVIDTSELRTMIPTAVDLLRDAAPTRTL